MCISAAVIAGASLLATAVGTFAQIDNAQYNKGMQLLQLEEQRKQLNEQREAERLRSLEAEAARLHEFNQLREANLAAIAGSGVGQNISFLQGGEEADAKALRRDLANIRLGFLGESSRISSQIKVNRIEGQVVKANAKAQIIGAGVNFVSSAASIGQYYNKNK